MVKISFEVKLLFSFISIEVCTIDVVANDHAKVDAAASFFDEYDDGKWQAAALTRY